MQSMTAIIESGKFRGGGQGRNRYTYGRSFHVSYCFFVAPDALERPYQQISGTKLAHSLLASELHRPQTNQTILGPKLKDAPTEAHFFAFSDCRS